MILIQTVWFRVMTFIWFLPLPTKENNFDFKVFLFQRIAVTSRRMMPVTRTLEIKYIIPFSPVSELILTQEQLRGKRRVRFLNHFRACYLVIIPNTALSVRYLASLMLCMMTTMVRLRIQKRMSNSRSLPLQMWKSSVSPLSGYFTRTNLNRFFVILFDFIILKIIINCRFNMSVAECCPLERKIDDWIIE